MKIELIKIEDNYVLVGPFTAPEEGMLFITRDNVLHTNIGWNYGDRHVIASTNTQHNVGKLSLKNCQAIERGYDLDELLKKEIANGKLHPNDGAKKEGIERGIQIALEILGDKKFSEEDLEKTIIWAHDKSTEGVYLSRLPITEFVQSLQQTEWDVEVEMEEYEPLYGEGSTLRRKLDQDGCLILKRI